MKKSLTFLLIGLISISITGCMGTFKYKVPPNSPISSIQYDCTVAVEPFKDERPTIGSNKMFFSWIPGVPFGWGHYNIPEDGKVYLTIQSFKFYPTVELAKAAEDSLKYSEIFKKIYFAQGYIEDQPDYIFSGNIKSTLYEEKIFTYCLSFFGSLLWLVGAPAGWTDNQLEIQFILKSVKDNKIIWTYTAKNSKDRVEWFYYQGQDVKNYVPVMQKCMQEAIVNLEEFMQNNYKNKQ
ncbi:MAG TPA: hypothetical protein QF753_12615 [Victivallales bacterium]|nr:hypothetical protein [Victivallales bacterium]